jgi:hypothetical protein
MHNRQSSQSYEYDAEFLLKALASLFVVSVSFTLLYANRNYLFVAGTNLKNYAGELKSQFFARKPDNTAPPPSVPYQTINASIAPAVLGSIEEKPELSSGSDSETPTSAVPSAAAVTPSEAEVITAEQKEEAAPDPDEDFVDAADEYRKGKLEEEMVMAQEQKAVNTPRPR